MKYKWKLILKERYFYWYYFCIFYVSPKCVLCYLTIYIQFYKYNNKHFALIVFTKMTRNPYSSENSSSIFWKTLFFQEVFHGSFVFLCFFGTHPEALHNFHRALLKDLGAVWATEEKVGIISKLCWCYCLKTFKTVFK